MADVIDFAVKTLRTPIEQTEVYQRAYRLAQDIHKATLNMPTGEQAGLADDLRRAVRAVCTHMIEGFQKQNKRSPSFYVEADISTMVAIDVAYQVDFMLRYARDLGYLNPDQCEIWSGGYIDLLNTLKRMNEAAQSGHGMNDA